MQDSMLKEMAEKEAELDRVAQECATLRAALDARVAASGANEMSLQAAHEAEVTLLKEERDKLHLDGDKLKKAVRNPSHDPNPEPSPEPNL